MTKEQLIKNGTDTHVGSCLCGYDLVVSEQDQEDGPADEILLECETQETGECVKGEWRKISEVLS